MGPPQGRAEGKKNLPRPAAHTPPYAPQNHSLRVVGLRRRGKSGSRFCSAGRSWLGSLSAERRAGPAVELGLRWSCSATARPYVGSTILFGHTRPGNGGCPWAVTPPQPRSAGILCPRFVCACVHTFIRFIKRFSKALLCVSYCLNYFAHILVMCVRSSC